MTDTGAGLGPILVFQVTKDPSPWALTNCLPSESHEMERSGSVLMKRESAALVFRSHSTINPDSKPIRSCNGKKKNKLGTLRHHARMI